jgi:hypothetical protein
MPRLSKPLTQRCCARVNVNTSGPFRGHVGHGGVVTGRPGISQPLTSNRPGSRGLLSARGNWTCRQCHCAGVRFSVRAQFGQGRLLWASAIEGTISTLISRLKRSENRPIAATLKAGFCRSQYSFGCGIVTTAVSFAARQCRARKRKGAGSGGRSCRRGRAIAAPDLSREIQKLSWTNARPMSRGPSPPIRRK